MECLVDLGRVLGLFRPGQQEPPGFWVGKEGGPADLEGVGFDFIAPLGPWGRLNRGPFHESGLGE